jgi:hypothetical protein
MPSRKEKDMDNRAERDLIEFKVEIESRHSKAKMKNFVF